MIISLTSWTGKKRVVNFLKPASLYISVFSCILGLELGGGYVVGTKYGFGWFLFSRSFFPMKYTNFANQNQNTDHESQAQPIDPDLTAKLLGRGVAVSPIVTVEPRRRKFHKAITLSMPAPKAHSQGMINQYSGNAPTLRLLCSITGMWRNSILTHKAIRSTTPKLSLLISVSCLSLVLWVPRLLFRYPTKKN